MIFEDHSRIHLLFLYLYTAKLSIMKITLFGAAGDVTGSAYYLQTNDASILIDFGIFQGGKNADVRNRKLPPVNFRDLDAIILTHAHLDHTGRLPLLARTGYRNTIYATPATIEMTALILHDSAKVQMFDMERMNRKRKRRGQPPITPLYSQDEVEKILTLFKPLDYTTPLEVAKGITVRAVEAGHILGSVSFEVTLTMQERKKTVIFSGDLGPQGMAILKDPAILNKADLVFMESTYGDRNHRSLRETLMEGESIILKAIERKGKILVPSFAVGRTQQLLYYLSAIHSKSPVHFPVYLDGPMGNAATNIYLKHPELYDEEALELIASGHLKTDLSHLKFCVTPDESKALNDLDGPCMIIAGAGMCNAGRIMHHLKHNLWNPETSVIIVGFQAEGTLGRKLVEGAKSVFIHGEKIVVRAGIHLLGGLSAHAGQDDLLHWFNSLAGSKPRLVLSHGEDKARQPLAEIIHQRYGIRAELPEYGEVIKL
jgi:metallo-beta-lactamase family protein